MTFRACCATRNAPRRLTSIRRSQASTSISLTAVLAKMPALLCTISMRPNRFTTASNIGPMVSGCETSTCSASASPPLASMPLATSSAPPRSCQPRPPAHPQRPAVHGRPPDPPRASGHRARPSPVPTPSSTPLSPRCAGHMDGQHPQRTRRHAATGVQMVAGGGREAPPTLMASCCHAPGCYEGVGSVVGAGSGSPAGVTGDNGHDGFDLGAARRLYGRNGRAEQRVERLRNLALLSCQAGLLLSVWLEYQRGRAVLRFGDRDDLRALNPKSGDYSLRASG